MARINLLPWREWERKRKQREFAGMAAAGAVLAAVAVVFAHIQMESMISGQNERNQFLEGEIKALDARIVKIKDLESTKAKLLARMNVIQELQSNRPLSVHLMDELVRTLPDGVHLKTFAQKGSELTMQGAAQSNARVSAYMRNIDGSEWLGNPKLNVIETKNEERRRIAEFTLLASQKATTTGQEAETGGTP
ncbi:MAG: PilN domain-containing protein [Gammaproteobacteria bacterium]|jgi:type IV pilus assembly protein PilN|nr:PilN domain-containing protein [Gammaproteobacteria bacterium]